AGEVVFSFGKYNGRPLFEIVERDAGYLRWIMKADFPMHVQNVCKGVLSGMTEQDFNTRILEHYGHPPEDAMTGQDD
ncbi:MAG: hypothetical protein ACO37D_04570, partial [Rhodothermales bacterium]